MNKYARIDPNIRKCDFYRFLWDVQNKHIGDIARVMKVSPITVCKGIRRSKLEYPVITQCPSSARRMAQYFWTFVW